MNCIVVDDEPIARKVVQEYINDIEFLELKGAAVNPLKATTLLATHHIDLIFLDIQMPKMNGIEFLKTSASLPMTIMTTAYPEYALEGYELDVIDYLVKPISFDRFLKACNKARDFYELRAGNLENDFFFVKSENKFEKIFFKDLLFIEAASNYVLLQTNERRFITYLTFKGIEEQLPQGQFIKVHKSFIVSLSQIESLNGEEIKIGKHTIPISRSLKDVVLEQVVNKHLFKR